MTTIREPTLNVASPIQQTSSPSVQVFWLNLDQVRTCLKKVVNRMVENRPEVEEVFLFGSLARGDAAPGSDADILVVLRESPLPFLERPMHYPLDFCGIGMDVLVYTRAEMAQMQTNGNHFFDTVYREGICLYRRTDGDGDETVATTTA